MLTQEEEALHPCEEAGQHNTLREHTHVSSDPQQYVH